MPVYSMTGYASASSGAVLATTEPIDTAPAASLAVPSPKASVTVELRSVNSRFLDLAFRLPDEFRALEPALRDLVGAAFRRGKIELRLNAHRESENAWVEPDVKQLMRLAQLERDIQSQMRNAHSMTVSEVLSWCKGGAQAERLDEAALDATRRCIAGLAEARAREGQRLVDILLERIGRLLELANQAEPLLPAIVQRQQQRFLERWEEALQTSGAAQTIPRDALQERALNEAAAYAIRIDVAEELARLRAHCEELKRILTAGGEVGKRLDFLIQELHREANTLGSKSTALEVTNISVEMKVLVEQLREQVQNIE